MRSERVANPNDLTPLQVFILGRLAVAPSCDGWIAGRALRHPGTVAKRRLELERAGLVKPYRVGGQIVTEKTPYGAPAVCHVPTKKGLRVLARYERMDMAA